MLSDRFGIIGMYNPLHLRRLPATIEARTSNRGNCTKYKYMYNTYLDIMALPQPLENSLTLYDRMKLSVNGSFS